MLQGQHVYFFQIQDNKKTVYAALAAWIEMPKHLFLQTVETISVPTFVKNRLKPYNSSDIHKTSSLVPISYDSLSLWQ